MMAILHGKKGDSGPRGRPPASVAAKYTDPGEDAPEQSGQDRGGNWDEHHHEKAKKRAQDQHKGAGKKSKSKLKKAEGEHEKCVGVIVMDAQNRILMGKQVGMDKWATPGGHVDPGESHAEAALRELNEETGLVGNKPIEVHVDSNDDGDYRTFLVESYRGTPKNTEEMKGFKWFGADEIEWDNMRDCCVKPLKAFIETKLGKSLKGMLALENLQKNIIRQRGDAVLEVTHGDALKLVGNGMFRILRNAVKGMSDEDFKDFKVDTNTISIRKHLNDIYSGRVSDGHKVIYQFTNKSLPELTAALMSVFEWYVPEDEKGLDKLLDDGGLSDDDIHGGLNKLVENYKRHNIGNIYEEMENIRELIRNGNAVDLQQVEGRIMKLFDKLESLVHDVAGKHNTFLKQVDKEFDELESKLRELQVKIDELENKPQTVEAYSSEPRDKEEVMENYSYLSRPQVQILPTGKIIISFGSDWQHLEKENFLSDMKAKVIKKSKR